MSERCSSKRSVSERSARLEASVVGRLAPSPTGAQHLGNARTFLLVWWLARRANGILFLRIEDLDTPRIKPWATAQVIEDLSWLGVDWDKSPPQQGSAVESPFWLQSDRLARYAEAMEQLKRCEAIYPCTCTRSDFESAQSAPHEDRANSDLDGTVYPGTCSSRGVEDASRLDETGKKYAWRFRMPDGPQNWVDQFAGSQDLPDLTSSLGDFVIGRSNGAPAYQIAVVVDDHDMAVNQIARGSDLIYSTYRQLAIHKRLGWDPPSYYHFPLVVGPDGKRLAKRHGDTRLSFYREQGVSPEQLIGFLAYHSGWIENLESVSAKDLLTIDILSKQIRDATVVSDNSLMISER